VHLGGGLQLLAALDLARELASVHLLDLHRLDHRGALVDSLRRLESRIGLLDLARDGGLLEGGNLCLAVDSGDLDGLVDDGLATVSDLIDLLEIGTSGNRVEESSAVDLLHSSTLLDLGSGLVVGLSLLELGLLAVNTLEHASHASERGSVARVAGLLACDSIETATARLEELLIVGAAVGSTLVRGESIDAEGTVAVCAAEAALVPRLAAGGKEVHLVDPLRAAGADVLLAAELRRARLRAVRALRGLQLLVLLLGDLRRLLEDALPVHLLHLHLLDHRRAAVVHLGGGLQLLAALDLARELASVHLLDLHRLDHRGALVDSLRRLESRIGLLDLARDGGLLEGGNLCLAVDSGDLDGLVDDGLATVSDLIDLLEIGTSGNRVEESSAVDLLHSSTLLDLGRRLVNGLGLLQV